MEPERWEKISAISKMVVELGERFEDYDERNGMIMNGLLNGVFTMYLDGKLVYLVQMLAIVKTALDIEAVEVPHD